MLTQLWNRLRSLPLWAQGSIGVGTALFILVFLGQLLVLAGLGALIIGALAWFRPVSLGRFTVAGRAAAVGLVLAGLTVTAVGQALVNETPPATDDEPVTALSVTTTTPATSITAQPTTTTTAAPTTTTSSTTTSTTTTTSPAAALPAGDDTTVTRIIDGDTFVIEGGDRVRLIGLDTPEVQQDACYSGEAAAFLTALIPPGTEVRLVYDVQTLDRFQRILAYVYRAEDGLFVNAELLAQGYAQILTIPPNVRHETEFLELQRSARQEGLGLWTACPAATTTTTTTTTTVPTTTTTTMLAPAANCDPSYPDVCIPAYPPDLDCGEISFRRFRVVGSDPHGFDGDNDGTGCES